MRGNMLLSTNWKWRCYVLVDREVNKEFTNNFVYLDQWILSFEFILEDLNLIEETTTLDWTSKWLTNSSELPKLVFYFFLMFKKYFMGKPFS